MTAEGLTLIAAVHRLAAIDRRAVARVAHLLAIGEQEARAVVGMAGGARVTAQALQADFGLSAGGAAALKDRLVRERVVRGEPDPDCPGAVRLRLRDGARLELEAALAGVADEIGRVAAELSTAERNVIVEWLDRCGSPCGPAAVDDQARAGHER
jgi:hypothetical protein